MAKVKMVPGIWGALTAAEALTSKQIQEKASALLSQMTLLEKIHQMSGDTPRIPGMVEMQLAYNKRPYPAGENFRLGIPGIRFTDGPRGVVMSASTCFPVTMGRGATWDMELEERVGDAIGVEARSQGANYFGGVCINLLRHPAWGRAQETYGEDSFHLGEMGASLVRGIQRHVMACIKHFAANSIENTRFKVDVRLNERALHEVYLPHFKRCVDEGAASVMSAYNKVNKEHCGHHAHLLRDILKGQWGFEGFVISDFLLGIRDTHAAITGGLDIEMPFAWHYGRKLHKLLESGQVSEAHIDDAVFRILKQKIRFAQIGEPKRYGPHQTACSAHTVLAREVAQKSIVLLKNNAIPETGKPLLPIDKSEIKQLAVIGRLASAENIGDKGSSMVHPPYVVTPLAGITAAVGAGVEVHVDHGRDIQSAVKTVCNADAVIVVVGYTHRQEGEYIPFSPNGGDRDSLSLTRHDEALIQAVSARNSNTVVILVGGSAIITESWRDGIPAILMAWYPGMEGGNAIADVLFGDVNPSGKLPCSFPKSKDHLPFFDKKAKSIEYDLYHGYRFMDKNAYEPAFAFGYGLSYTTFTYSNLQLAESEISPDGTLQVSADITNSGEIVGDEVVQLYIGCSTSRVDRPMKELKGFVKIRLNPGETVQVDFRIPAKQLAYYDEDRSDWVVEPADYTVYVGSSALVNDLPGERFQIRGN
ncbi:MAG: glycoside hydrolase family 3 C-terminal domain-containing protein [Desulfobacterales bacterium]